MRRTLLSAPCPLPNLPGLLHTRPQVTLFFSESPTNPYLRCVDVPEIARLCHAKGTIVCIDSTFATPVNSKAIALGADLVIHSATKYLAGHNDVLAGTRRAARCVPLSVVTAFVR